MSPTRGSTAPRCAVRASRGSGCSTPCASKAPRPELTADELVAAADRLQSGLAHRRIDLEDAPTAERLRPAFDALGWETERLVWLSLAEPPPGPDAEEAPVAATRELRLAWGRAEDSLPEAVHQRQADAEEDVMATLGARAVVARDDSGEIAAFVTFTNRGGTAEIESAYVTPALRGRGIGGALVAAAARTAGAEETLIVADDEGEAKRLYLRLGFEPVWIHHAFTRKPKG